MIVLLCQALCGSHEQRETSHRSKGIKVRVWRVATARHDDVFVSDCDIDLLPSQADSRRFPGDSRRFSFILAQPLMTCYATT